jgi:hypothetical protein
MGDAEHRAQPEYDNDNFSDTSSHPGVDDASSPDADFGEPACKKGGRVESKSPHSNRRGVSRANLALLVEGTGTREFSCGSQDGVC